MKRYGVPSLEALLNDWNPGQILLAVDSMFWNQAKEADKYRESDAEIATAPPISARDMARGMGLLM